MKLLENLRNNFSISLSLNDIAGRVIEIPSNPEDISFEQMEKIWVQNLKSAIGQLKSGQKKIDTISPENIEIMTQKIDNCLKAGKGLELSFSEFFREHPELKTRYTNILGSEEGTYNLESDIETIHMKVELPSENGEHVIRALISFDNPNALKQIQKLTSYEDQEYLRGQLVEAGAFPYSLDIGEKINGMIVPLATYNEVNGEVAGKNSPLVENLGNVVEYDGKLLQHFYNNNIAYKEYKENRKLLKNILSNCQKDNLLTEVTDDSLLAFNTLIEASKAEQTMKSSVATKEFLTRISGMRSDYFPKPDGNTPKPD